MFSITQRKFIANIPMLFVLDGTNDRVTST